MAKDDFSQGGGPPESAGQISPTTAIGLARQLEVIGHDLRRLAAPVMADASTLSASFEGALAALTTAVEDVRRLDAASAVKLESETAERQKAEATLRKTLRARTVMAECNHALLHETGEGELFERMCRIIVEFGHYPAAWIGLVRSDSEQTVAPVAHAGHEDGFLREWRFVLEDPDHNQTPAGLAIRSGLAVRLADLASETRWEGWRKQVMSRGYGSVLVFPLREQYRVFGVLSIYDWDASAFTDDEASLLQELADDIAYGVANLRVEAARERAERRLATQFEIARLLAESATLVEATPAILDVISELFSAEIALAELWVADLADSRLIRLGAWGGEGRSSDSAPSRSERSLLPDDSLMGQVWRSGTVQWVPDFSLEGDALGPGVVSHQTLCSGCGLPIRNDGQVLGVMVFFSANRISPRDELGHLFAAIGSQIGVFIIRKRAEESLRVSEEKLSGILGSIDNIVWSMSPMTWEIHYLNDAAAKVWGRPVETLIARPALVLAGLRDEDCQRLPALYAELCENGVLTAEYPINRPDGERRWLEIRVKLITDAAGKPSRIDGVATDITARKQYEASIEFLATHDALTRLPNRALLADRLHQALAHARRSDRALALLFLDLDRFKDVNDSFGHAFGDSLLRAVSARLQACVRRGDTVARQGGDEFLILLSDLEKMANVEQVALKIQREFSLPFLIEGHELFMSGSMGASVFPEDGEDMESLLKHADTAMYRAKEEGGNGFRFYSHEMSQRAIERVGLENALRRALEQQQLALWYQPKLALRGGTLLGAEALLRWQHPQLGPMLPGRFIALAEEIGLIEAIGYWVLKTACRQTRRWLDAGLQPGPIAVNLSVRQLRSPTLVDTVAEILAACGLEGHFLELEVTETMLMEEPESVIPILTGLKQLGVKLALDDFGTGYSSLSYLKRFPFDHLKIDRSFVGDISTDSNDTVIVQSIISLGHSLGLKVIAEGVETAEQLRFLKQHHCDAIQGYHVTEPLPEADFTRWLLGRQLPAGVPD